MYAAKDNRVIVVDKLIELGCNVNHMSEVSRPGSAQLLSPPPMVRIAAASSLSLPLCHPVLCIDRR